MAALGNVNANYLSILKNIAVGLEYGSKNLVEAAVGLSVGQFQFGGLSRVDRELTETKFEHKQKPQVLLRLQIAEEEYETKRAKIAEHAEIAYEGFLITNGVNKADPSREREAQRTQSAEQKLKAKINTIFEKVLMHIEKRIKAQYKSVNKTDLDGSVTEFVTDYLQTDERDETLSQLCLKHQALTGALNDRAVSFGEWKDNLLTNESLKKCHSGLYSMLNKLFGFLGLSARIQSKTAEKVALVFSAPEQEVSLRRDYVAAVAA